jgi:hypothetical protein
MERSNPTDPVLADDLQMRPIPKTPYVNLEGAISEADHEQTFSEQKVRVLN